MKWRASAKGNHREVFDAPAMFDRVHTRRVGHVLVDHFRDAKRRIGHAEVGFLTEVGFNSGLGQVWIKRDGPTCEAFRV